MAKSPPAAAALTFEAALAQLDALVPTLEAGDLPLDAALAAYQKGSELVTLCQARLDAAEATLTVLEGDTLVPLTLENPHA